MPAMREAGSARWSWIGLCFTHSGELWEAPPTPSPGVTLAQDSVPQQPRDGSSAACSRASGASTTELTSREGRPKGALSASCKARGALVPVGLLSGRRVQTPVYV